MKKLSLLVVPFLLVGLVGCGKGEAKESNATKNSNASISQYVDLEGNETKQSIPEDMVLYPKDHKFIDTNTHANFLSTSGKDYFHAEDYDYDFGDSISSTQFSLFMRANSRPFEYLIIEKDDPIHDNKKAVKAIGDYNLEVEKVAKKYYPLDEYYDIEPLNIIPFLYTYFKECYNEDEYTFDANNQNWDINRYLTGYYEKSIAYNKLIHELRESTDKQKFSEQMEKEINDIRKNLFTNNTGTSVGFNSDSVISLDAKVEEADKLYFEDIAKEDLKGLAAIDMNFLKIPQDIYPVD